MPRNLIYVLWLLVFVCFPLINSDDEFDLTKIPDEENAIFQNSEFHNVESQDTKIQNTEFQNIESQNTETQNTEFQNIKTQNTEFQNIESVTNCVDFNPSTFGRDNASIFVIEAKGRLGNHLMAYTLIKAMESELKIQPLILENTYELVSKFFKMDNGFAAPVFQRKYCNWHDMYFEPYRKGIDQLIEEDQHLYKGHLVNLWPEGYKIDAKYCCPAQELMDFLLKNNLPSTRKGLEFLPKFTEAADETLRTIAAKLNREIEDITFVGIHNRRTDYIAYMEQMYNIRPLKKSYFYDAMNHFRDENAEYDMAVAFLYVSDDMEWGRKNIKSKGHKDIFFVGKGDGDDPEAIGYDLALLASCNATITTRGSFSTWAAILAGGEYYSTYGASVLPDQQNQKRKRRKKKKVEL